MGFFEKIFGGNDSKKPLALFKVDLSKSGATFEPGYNESELIIERIGDATFKEIGNNTVRHSFEGTYGNLVKDKETLLYKKSWENNKLLEIVQSVVVSGLLGCALRIGCNATDEEILEFYDGVESGYRIITVNNIRAFDDAQIRNNIDVMIQYSQYYLEEFRVKKGENEANMLSGGTKASDYIVELLYKSYRLDDELSEIEMITGKVNTGIDVSCFSLALMEQLRHSIKRNK